MKTRAMIFALAFTVVFFHTASIRTSAAELITNGGFENATPFLGWTRVNSPNPWNLWQNSSAGAGGGFLSVAPTSIVEGTRNVWNGMTDYVTNNSQWEMYQNFAIPAGASVTVTWRDRYQINHTQFCPSGTCQPKFYYVEIMNSTGTTLLQNLHTQSTIGNVNQDTGWVTRTATINFPGQTVRLRFRGTETVPLSGPGQIEIDAVSARDFVPTAAMVSVGGRVLTAAGNGIRNTEVTIVGANGFTKTTQTGSMGIYRFDGIEVGETYTITVNARKFYFMNPSRIVSVKDSASDIDFVALE